ncbi:hypothetical protein K7H22_05195, partial [Seohaeicola saemankumensis]|uniref:hypothetical protein n=1 Tax=Seohaeicola saemankumensis TaxID=481181 RepID=UPI001E4AA62A
PVNNVASLRRREGLFRDNPICPQEENSRNPKNISASCLRILPKPCPAGFRGVFAARKSPVNASARPRTCAPPGLKGTIRRFDPPESAQCRRSWRRFPFLQERHGDSGFILRRGLWAGKDINTCEASA